MSKQEKSVNPYDASNLAPKELSDLAGLEIRRRRLLRELATVEHQCQQVQLEIQLKGIQAHWLKNGFS